MRLKFDDFDEAEVMEIKNSIAQNTERKTRLSDSMIYRDRSINIMAPHKEFYASTESLLHFKNTEAFEYSGMQYLITNDQKVIALAGLIKIAGGAYSVKFNYGDHVSNYRDVFIMLDKYDGKGEFHFAVLKIPAIYLTAAWLKKDKESFFFPFSVLPTGIDFGRLYAEEDFFGRILDLVMR